MSLSKQELLDFRERDRQSRPREQGNYSTTNLSLAFFHQLRARIADHPQLFQSRSVLGPRRVDGSRLNEGKGCPPNVVIIGTDGSGLSVLDAGAIGGTGVGLGLALAITARPKSRGRSRTFHGRTSPESLPSSAASSRGPSCPRGARGRTPDSNCINGILQRRGKQCANCV